MKEDQTTETPMRARIGAVAAATILGIAGLGAAGCGDDDGEGPVEEAGQAIDEGASDAGSEIDEAAEDTGEAAEEGAEEATTDDDK